MASLTIRKLDDDLKTRLRIRAAEEGVSVEEEARRILARSLVAPAAERHWVDVITAMADKLDVDGIELPARDDSANPATFD
ncbi:MAG: FitA-like ribbon-helix-helix domain-containing protein [Bauldia sp.]